MLDTCQRMFMIFEYFKKNKHYYYGMRRDSVICEPIFITGGLEWFKMKANLRFRTSMEF